MEPQSRSSGCVWLWSFPSKISHHPEIHWPQSGPGSQCGGAGKSMHLIKRLPHWPWGEFQDSCEIENKTHPSEVLFLPGCLGLMSASQAGPWSPVKSSLWSSQELTLCMFYYVCLGWVRFYHLIWKHYRSTWSLLSCWSSPGYPPLHEVTPAKWKLIIYFSNLQRGERSQFLKYALSGEKKEGVSDKEIVCLKMEGVHFST